MRSLSAHPIRSARTALLVAALLLFHPFAHPSGSAQPQSPAYLGERGGVGVDAVRAGGSLRSEFAPSLVVLVRHAERAGPSASDPGLTSVGAERARELARLLGDAEITRIHSSDTRRTRETAGPLAGSTGVPVELYDPRDLEGFAARLASEPGRHLVVGHSNTTDELSRLLGGASYGEIVEEWEYDRLYLLTPAPGGGVETVLIRFGPVVQNPSQ